MNVQIIGNKCTGCRACEQVCPENAITFKENTEGFLYPCISQKCVNCGLCLNKCHIHSDVLKMSPQNGFAAYVKDESVLKQSTSGGIFAGLAISVLRDGGAVFGCAEKQPGEVRHLCIEQERDICLLQGSKYVESDIDSVYSSVQMMLENGRCVLFSGVPCQIAGLKAFLGRDYDNLFTADIVCHGVPSRKLYRAYLKWEEEREKGTIIKYSFRSKIKHGWSLTYRLEYKKGKKLRVKEHIATLSPYYYHFLQKLNFRESCYQCKYAQTERVADITLCDFWGIEKVMPSMQNGLGVSGVLINSEKGMALWNSIKNEVTAEAVSINDIADNNGQLRTPSERPPIRDMYYDEINKYGFDAAAKEYTAKKALIIDAFKDTVPNKYRQKAKSILHGLRSYTETKSK